LCKILSISQHQERDFVLRVSAFEIYNEIVVDLLKRESGSLRLLDDPEVFARIFSHEEVLDGFIMCFL
jgi:hypothetical protein